MKRFYLSVILIIISLFIMAGCSATSSSQPSTKNTAASTAQGTRLTGIKVGVVKMISTSAILEKQIKAGDEAMVKATGPKLEKEWKSFENKVKGKYPNLYAKVEKYLDPTVAGSKSSPLDQKTLSKLNQKLSNALKNLSNK